MAHATAGRFLDAVDGDQTVVANPHAAKEAPGLTAFRCFAHKIGVSITPVIHALKWLEFKNIVIHEPNRGYIVDEVSVQEIKEIYDTRLLLEVSLVPAIIESIDEDSLQNVRSSQKEYLAAVDEGNYYRRLMTDMKFHLTLASISQCRIQLKMLQELFDMLLLKNTPAICSCSALWIAR
jgi:DNA-binding GntR family transcriptional regulator